MCLISGEHRGAFEGISLQRKIGGFFTAIKEIVARTMYLTFYIPWLILIPIIAFFWLKDGAVFRQRLIQSLPEWEWRLRATHFLSDVGDALAAYIRAQLLACLIIGTIVVSGLSLLGSPYPVVIGVLAGLLEFIPVVGPFTIMVLATGVAAFDSWKLAALVLSFLLILRVAQDYIIYPRLISREIEMHPLLVILAVLCGAELGGVIGVFLSVPVTALVIVIWRHGMSISAGSG
ncbi:MAG: AI-2E family transporter [Deltaproteobacteria bacterium]|nr:AI-2E family transporter [Deltaproteobacteria bacterium]